MDFLVIYQGHEEILAAEADGGADRSFQRFLDDDHIERAAHVNKCDRHQQDDDRNENFVNGPFSPDDWNAAELRLAQELLVLGFVGDTTPQIDGNMGITDEDSRHVQVSRPGRIWWKVRLT